jgi:hypothetical protein
MDYLCNFKKTAQSNQSPEGRKFAQSGHPEHEWLRVYTMMEIDESMFGIIVIITLALRTGKNLDTCTYLHTYMSIL